MPGSGQKNKNKNKKMWPVQGKSKPPLRHHGGEQSE